MIWLVLGVAGGVAIVNHVRADDPPASNVTAVGPSSSATAKSAKTPATKKTTRPTTEPSSEPTTEPTTQETVAATRSIGVVIYNQIGVGGLAARVAGQAQTAGWSVVDTGNWRGSVPQDTVYYPPGQQAEAALLGSDLAISRIMPAVANMSDSYLTVVLASPR